MKECQFDEIVKIWSNNTDPTMLYIHSPFCRSQCSYCVYRGKIEQPGEVEFYYNEYLPQQINKYKDIIDEQNITAIYFGGGTPNLYGLKYLKKAFELTKDVIVDEKIIELHVGIDITDEDLDLLSEYDFTTVILCVQTFNQKILNQCGRYNKSNNDINALIKKLHDRGISVGMDLIQFCSSNEGKDIFKDVEHILSLENKPDEITIAPLYQSKHNGSKWFNDYKKYKRILSNNGYNHETELISNFRYENEQQCFEMCNTMRFFTKEASAKYQSKTFYSFIQYLGEKEDRPKIGIGSFYNPDKNVYSSTREYSYIEKYDEETKSPRYFLTRYMSFYDKARALIDWMEKVSVEPPPIGLSIYIKNETGMTTHSEDWEEEMSTFNIRSEMDMNSSYIDQLNKSCRTMKNNDDILFHRYET